MAAAKILAVKAHTSVDLAHLPDSARQPCLCLPLAFLFGCREFFANWYALSNLFLLDIYGGNKEAYPKGATREY